MALAAIRYAGPKPGSRIHCYNPPVPELTESAVERDPFVQFAKWYAEARAVVKPHPNAAALATAAGGRASVRMVLVKDHDRNGFVFYTNYASRKARELRCSARASLLFYWGTLERQVRVDGRIEKVTRRESDGYFAT